MINKNKNIFKNVDKSSQENQVRINRRINIFYVEGFDNKVITEIFKNLRIQNML